jgi:Family of unknown function (DUF6508)
MNLENLPAHLDNMDPVVWTRLYELVRAIYIENEFGKIQETQKRTKAYLEFPHWEYTEKIADFNRMVYAMDIVIGFDWLEWKEGQAMLKDPDQEYAQLDGITLCKLITLVVRAERFYEGYLNNCFENGSVLKIVTALKEHYSR